ncbi:proteasome beta type-3 subunit [Encephalitozoon hellem]|uniref:20S proteasome subunit n=1 Tax=Encephalitozoon hellem TaxID=27973 RepID=A0A9Q9C1U1_ENCHE|nr:proteasome beta type-3 subunit [Encephalitozoon hellem ATCC 50504]AFM97784.1 proteasome beta type-3 subunit [Encephalitozoon hellem ATCC 50504]KAG5859472.1 proteasome beta type-3 subunit [Encephalitozoon hellem]UTX42554.1 proteasome subunit beta type-5 [Encephalitozoon hellem]WEL38009.1 20S proteasome subunit [Encephalitozoon hellem]|eukprot:XP_003886765.1 proteasome beta type-3 subunit [Encephalitozoon hellem ATCC 50504]
MSADIETFYGGSVLAMASENAVAIMSDRRLGMGPITVSKEFTRIHKIGPRLYVGLPVFIPDTQVLLKKIRKNYNLFRLEEQREMEPEELSSMISFLLYSKRTSPYITSPIVAGLTSDGKPYVSSMDSIGSITSPKDFVAAGTAGDNLIGICEALYRPGMDEENLFVTCTQAFLNAVDRDALSGWGADCYIISQGNVTKRSIKGRCD